MSIIVNGTRVKNVVFNRKNVLLVKNKKLTEIFKKAGITWTQSNITSGYFSGGARYANGLWVACGSGSGSKTYGLYWSEDGKTWTQSNITSGSFSGGARYANRLWVACGDIIFYSEEI